MSIQLSLALLLLVAMSEQLEQVEGRKKLCGESLNQALDLICVHGFSHRLGSRRRRSPEEELQRKWNQIVVEQQLDRLVDMGAMEAEGSQRELRRSRRRITHECCDNGCTYEDIGRYCA